MRKPAFYICENKEADQLLSNCAADQCLCFRYLDSTILLLPKSKFQASSHLLWLYSPVCVRPGRKPQRQFFSERGSNYFCVCFFRCLVKPRLRSVISWNGCVVSHNPWSGYQSCTVWRPPSRLSIRQSAIFVKLSLL